MRNITYSEPLAEIGGRRIFCRPRRFSGRLEALHRAEQPEDAVCGKNSDTSHQVAERLEMASDPEMAGAEFVLQAGVGAFGGGSFVVGRIPRICDVDQPAACPLGGDFGLAACVATGVALDHGNPARGDAIIDDGLGIVGGIHEIVEPNGTLFAGPGERDGDLAVMGGSGGENGGDRDAAIGGIPRVKRPGAGSGCSL